MRRKYGGLLGRLASFSALPFLGAILPFIVLPVLARITTANEWAAVNVGFGIGAITSAVGLMGWNILGTPLVALARDDQQRKDLYGRSFYIRAVGCILLVIPAVALSALMAPSAAWILSAMMAVGTTFSGLGISWYAVGVATPRLIVVYDIAPRAVATALTLALVQWLGDPLWYGIALTVASIVGTLLFNRTLLGHFLPAWPGLAPLRHDLREMRAAWGIESITNTYSNAPVPLTSALASVTEASNFASADRVYRYGIMGVGSVANALQGWVLESSGSSRPRRNLAAIAIMGGIGVIGALFLTFAGPWFTGILFGDKRGDPLVMGILGIAFFGIASTTPLIRNILIPARVDRQVLTITIISAIVGIALMIGLGVVWGAVGVAVGFSVSEILMLAACIVLASKVGLHPVTPGTPPR